MLDLLKDLCKEGNMAAIYTDSSETSKFLYGQVLAVNDKHIAILMTSQDGGYDDAVGIIDIVEKDRCKIDLIDEYGYADGIAYIRISDITQISYASADEKRIMLLKKE